MQDILILLLNWTLLYYGNRNIGRKLFGNNIENTTIRIEFDFYSIKFKKTTNRDIYVYRRVHRKRAILFFAKRKREELAFVIRL